MPECLIVAESVYEPYGLFVVGTVHSIHAALPAMGMVGDVLIKPAAGV